MLLTALVFQGTFCWYAFFNPDEHLCYYYEGEVTDDSDYIPFIDPDWKEDPEWREFASNVSHQFKLWFFCGMILCSLYIVYGILGFVFQCTKNVKLAKIANCFMILGYVSTIVWLVNGTLIRY